MVTLNVDAAGALTQFAIFVRFFIVVQARRPLLLHLRVAASLSAGLGDGAVTVLVFFVGQVNLRLKVLIGVIVDFLYLVVYIGISRMLSVSEKERNYFTYLGSRHPWSLTFPSRS